MKNLKEIAEELKNANKKVQLIYAFNGTGKTRLSREFKQLIASKNNDDVEQPIKFIYYNAFTEDLFYWDNDLEGDTEHKLNIQPNRFTDFILKDQGQDQNIITDFQLYVDDKLTPSFNQAFTEVTFSFKRGTDELLDTIKISKGEESLFVWSIFYNYLKQIISVLNVVEADERETNQFNQLEYVFIDDPVSSLDENHLIELAVNLAGLITASTSELKFIITTHNPLFYNVLHNEIKQKDCYLLERFEDGTFDLKGKKGDSNSSFSYHLHLKQNLEQAVTDNKIEKYHFTLLRNLYEKTASFLGYQRWSKLLPGNDDETRQAYYARIINFTSHSSLSNEVVAEPSPEEKKIISFLLNHLQNNYGYVSKEKENG